MNLTEHPAVQWFFLKWPKWVKITSLIVAIAGGLGTVMGLGGSIVNAIHSRDTKMQAEAIAKELDKQHDDKVEATLVEHGKAIEATKAGVQDIQNHLSKQDVQILETKDTLGRIETAIMLSGNARPVLGSSPAHP